MKSIASAVKIIAFVICCTLLFNACAMFDLFSVDELMRTPKLTGENALIQQAFEEAVGAGVSLLSPVSGEYRSAYVLNDIDGDTYDEAIVFYKNNQTASDVHMHLLDFDGKEWFSVADVVGNGTDVYSIEFCNLDQGNLLEIAVVWTMPDAARSKNLVIYKISVEKDIVKKLSSLGTVSVFDYLFVDLDFDGLNEMFYIYYDNTVSPRHAAARVMEIDAENELIQPSSELKFASDVVSFAGLTSDLKDGTYRMYIDCIAANSEYFTQIVFYDSEKATLMTPSFLSAEACKKKTSRASKVLSQDINTDYLIEIPVEKDYPSSETVNLPGGAQEPIKVLEWLRLSEKELQSLGKYYRNTYDGFTMSIDSFYEYSYITYDYDTHTTQFRLKDFDEEENLLFSVVFLTDTDSENAYKAPTYTVKITQLGDSMDISPSFVKEQIELN